MNRHETQISLELREQIEKLFKEDLRGHIFLAARKVNMFVMNVLKEFDIGFEQVGVLRVLKLSGGLNLKQLSIVLEKDKATVSRCLESLYKKGYVKRIQQTTDKRIYMAYLTKEGEEFSETLHNCFCETLMPLDDILSEDDMKYLHRMLGKICEHYDMATDKIRKRLKSHSKYQRTHDCHGMPENKIKRHARNHHGKH